jgi:hypothetical protein
VIQAQFGIAWGGIFGTGWGLGRPNITPLAKTDFIAAALGEEIAITGLIAIVMIYAVIVARAFRAALGAKDPFGKLLAAGLGFVFAIQVFAIIGGVTRLLPLTGLTTPFMSQGGSSLVTNWIMVGLLLVITHQVRRPASVVAAMPMASLEGDTTELIDVSPLMATPRPAAPPDLLSPEGSPDDKTGKLPIIDADQPTGPIPATGPIPTGDETAEIARPDQDEATTTEATDPEVRA